eukprot:jgi/Bigna1/85183/estExt_fgenesh1_pg.C_20386
MAYLLFLFLSIGYLLSAVSSIQFFIESGSDDMLILGLLCSLKFMRNAMKIWSTPEKDGSNNKEQQGEGRIYDVATLLVYPLLSWVPFSMAQKYRVGNPLFKVPVRLPFVLSALVGVVSYFISLATSAVSCKDVIEFSSRIHKLFFCVFSLVLGMAFNTMFRRIFLILNSLICLALGIMQNDTDWTPNALQDFGLWMLVSAYLAAEFDLGPEAVH